MKKIGFIGCGNMGGALAIAVGKKEKIFLYDKDEARARELSEKVEGAELCSFEEFINTCDYVILGVKPNIIPAVAEQIKNCLKDGRSPCLVSMAAGVSTRTIDELLCEAALPVIRIMPNTPVAVGEGMILVCNNGAVSDSMLSEFIEILEYAGKIDVIPEELIDAGSALSGCGPAFVYMYIDALAEAGEKCGLAREKALLYAAQTAKGAAEMLLCSDTSPRELTGNVCSPGGSTIEGVKSLENDALSRVVCNAVKASYEKTLLLGKADKKQS